MNSSKPLFLYFVIVLITATACVGKEQQEKVSTPETNERKVNLFTEFPPTNKDGTVNAVIEIPTGTVEKWEVTKTMGQLELEQIDGAPRLVKYLGYPGNYGMIPRTLLSKESGGDGDPLDILVLGPSARRGSVLECKIIGVLYLQDKGEQDDKLIAVSPESAFYSVTDIKELELQYNGVSEIIEIWFSNYKGTGKMESKGFGSRMEALEILNEAIDQYEFNKTENVKVDLN